jgi:hypothetical protein
LLAGWYFNNCYCRDSCSSDACFEGDVHAAVDFGFDRCGPGCTVVQRAPLRVQRVFNHHRHLVASCPPAFAVCLG